MSATVEQPEVAPEQAPPALPEGEAPAPAPVAEEAQPVEAVRLCASCATPLAAGQDWCLECGTAQPGRLGGRAGWRAALSVMGATGVLALGAGAVAYAALSSEANRAASAAAPPAAAPILSSPPPQIAPPPPVDTPTVDAPDSEPADIPEVKAPADPVDDVVDAGPTGGDAAGDDTSSDAGKDDEKADDKPKDEKDDTAPPPNTIVLDVGAASTYDPDARGQGLTGEPADAIDGKDSTGWEAPADAEGKVGIGLAISLDRDRLIDAMRFEVGTPGITVEVYATDAKTLPPTLADKRWSKIDTRREVSPTEKVTIGRKPYRHVLLWVTEQPADSKAIISEIELLK